MGGSSGGGGSTPETSQEEKNLRESQAELIRAQLGIVEQGIETQGLLDPFLFEEAGLDPVFDEEGKLVSISKKPDIFANQLGQVTNLSNERLRTAIAGDQPINPALVRSLDREQENTEEDLRRRFGKDFRTSTPAQQALQGQSERRLSLFDADRRTNLSFAEQLGFGLEQQEQQRIQGFLSNATAIPVSTSVFSQSLGQVAQGFNLPLSSFRSERQAQAASSAGGGPSQTVSALSGAASGAAIGTAISPGIGTAVGAVAGGLLGLFG